MKKKVFGLVLFLLIPFSIVCQERSTSLFSVRLTPGVNIPLGRDTDLMGVGAGGYVSGEFRMPFLSSLYASADVGYNHLNLYTDTNMSLFAFGVGAGYDFPIISWMDIRVFAKGGYFYGFFHDASAKGGNPFVSGGLGVYFHVADPISVGIEGSYKRFLGFSNDIGLRAGAAFHFGPRTKRVIREKPVSPQPEPLEQSRELGKEEGLVLRDIEFDDIFPVFFKYYDNNPVGSALLENTENVPIEDISITFLVKQYMDNPKRCTAPETLAPGESAEIELNALFTDSVLEISEGTKVSAQILAEYVMGGNKYSREIVETIRLFDRNATTWDDDRKAAAFVTAKDSAVLRFSKQVSGMIQGKAGRGVNENLLTAIGIHTALSRYGIRYIVDPGSSYEEFSKNKTAIDYLQFPRQSLEFKAGDCDDLSILYAALLESVGIETAFITVPGHIFLAFSLNEAPDTARRKYLRPDELIFTGEKSWVPFEVTEIDGGFLKAWEIGAREWRQSSAREQAELIPMRESWKIFEPVGFTADKLEISIPPEEGIVNDFREEVTAFIDREISSRVAQITAEISGSNNSARAINKLGVLYAKYGLNSRAEREFRRILEREDYVPALINLGNIHFLEDNIRDAREYYERAERISPDNPKVLLAVARVNHSLENFGSVQDAYGRLKEIDPGLAARFSYLDLRGEEATRAAEIGQVTGVVVWDEE